MPGDAEDRAACPVTSSIAARRHASRSTPERGRDPTRTPTAKRRGLDHRRFGRVANDSNEARSLPQDDRARTASRCSMTQPTAGSAEMSDMRRQCGARLSACRHRHTQPLRPSGWTSLARRSSAGREEMIVPGVRQHPGFIAGTWTLDRETSESFVTLTSASLEPAEAMHQNIVGDSQNQQLVDLAQHGPGPIETRWSCARTWRGGEARRVPAASANGVVARR